MGRYGEMKPEEEKVEEDRPIALTLTPDP